MRLAGAVAFAVWCGCAGALRAQQPLPAALDSLEMRAHTYFLAHDLLLGRGTGRHGNALAAAYIATQAEKLGLRGAGAAGSYYQSVPLVEATVDPTRTSLMVTFSDSGPARRVAYAYGQDFIPDVGSARTLIGFGGAAVFVGAAREIVQRAAPLPPLEGRVAVLAGLFGSDAAAADTLRAHGAVGVVHLLPREDLFRLYVDSRGPSRMYLADATVASSFISDIPAVVAAPALTRALAQRIVAAGGGERPVALEQVRIDVAIGVRPQALTSRNVAAVLPGSDRALANEYVVYTAHLDHLGISTPDANGDSVYNGFSDNAAGSAMLLAIARAMSSGPRPARSVLFLWFTGEERGLLGSDYFVAHPLVPTERIAGVINLDAGAPPAPPVEWRIAGGNLSSLGELAVGVAGAMGWRADLSAPNANSDYFPFLRVGVPAVFIVPGPGPYERMTLEQSQQLRARWDHYHQPGDHWRPDFPWAGVVRYAEYAWRLGMALGAADQPKPRLAARP